MVTAEPQGRRESIWPWLTNGLHLLCQAGLAKHNEEVHIKRQKQHMPASSEVSATPAPSEGH